MLVYFARREQAVAARAPVHFGEHYDTLGSYVAIAVATLPASQPAEERPPHAIPAVRTRVFVL